VKELCNALTFPLDVDHRGTVVGHAGGVRQPMPPARTREISTGVRVADVSLVCLCGLLGKVSGDGCRRKVWRVRAWQLHGGVAGCGGVSLRPEVHRQGLGLADFYSGP
jgi:hypothetical protein